MAESSAGTAALLALFTATRERLLLLLQTAQPLPLPSEILMEGLELVAACRGVEWALAHGPEALDAELRQRLAGTLKILQARGRAAAVRCVAFH